MTDESQVSLPPHFDSPASKVRVIQALRKYPVKRMAAAQAGVTERTVYKWLEEDEQFRDLCNRAIEEGKRVVFDSILLAAKNPSTWQAGAWILERIDPETFGKIDRSQVQVSGPGGGPVVTAHVELSDGSLAERVRGVLSVLRDAGALPPGVYPELIDVGSEPDDGAAAESAPDSPVV